MKLEIIRTDGIVEVLLFRNKSDNTYSYVNLTKGHICPCKFKTIEDDIKIKAKRVSSILIETFFNTLNAPLKEFEQRLINEEATLEEKISTFEENEKNKAELSIDLHKNIKKLESIMSNIKGLN